MQQLKLPFIFEGHSKNVCCALVKTRVVAGWVTSSLQVENYPLFAGNHLYSPQAKKKKIIKYDTNFKDHASSVVSIFHLLRSVSTSNHWVFLLYLRPVMEFAAEKRLKNKFSWILLSISFDIRNRYSLKLSCLPCFATVFRTGNHMRFNKFPTNFSLFERNGVFELLQRYRTHIDVNIFRKHSCMHIINNFLKIIWLILISFAIPRFVSSESIKHHSLIRKGDLQQISNPKPRNVTINDTQLISGK